MVETMIIGLETANPSGCRIGKTGAVHESGGGWATSRSHKRGDGREMSRLIVHRGDHHHAALSHRNITAATPLILALGRPSCAASPDHL